MLVQKLRLKKGWSQQRLADLSGLNVRTIQRIEKGQSASMESLKSLAAVFEIDFTTLQESSMPTTPADRTTRHEARPATSTVDEVLALQYVRKLKGLYLHAAQYVLVVGALAIFNLWRTPDRLWFWWVALGWGLGLLMHAARILNRGPLGPAWEKAQVEKRLGRLL